MNNTEQSSFRAESPETTHKYYFYSKSSNETREEQLTSPTSFDFKTLREKLEEIYQEQRRSERKRCVTEEHLIFTKQPRLQ